MASPPPPHGPYPYPQPYPQPHPQPYPQAYPQQPMAPAGQPPAGPYAPSPGHPAPAPGPYGYGPQPHLPPHATDTGCTFCGAQPAVRATVRGHQGILYVMRFLSRSGQFCRSCGLATYREMSAKTLWQGWWSPLSVVITPITLLLNLGPRSRFRKLAAPAGGFRPPLDPGRSLLRRPEALLFLIPAVLVALAIPALLVVGLVADGTGFGKTPTLAVGDCVRNDGDWRNEDLEVVDCGSADAQYKVRRLLDTSAAHCDHGDMLGDPEYGPDKMTISCLAPLR
ncbi:hypothetical protein AB0C96_21225 [Streptomyces sp. NPDC048506]|uniref:LppU/SCO3897 family protein n=1 Tax=Streptomyces sp. NPDC048506 TaxID=3155028 RepID=UPI00343E2C90